MTVPAGGMPVRTVRGPGRDRAPGRLPTRRGRSLAGLPVGFLLAVNAGGVGAVPAFGGTARAETVGGQAAVEAPGSSEAEQASAPGRYRDWVVREARRHGLPSEIADAVVHVESGYRPGAVGTVGELGLMQVRPSTATMLGHRGPATALLDPETNIRFGVAYLAQAWNLAKGDLCRALMKYRAGHGEERMTPRSVEYCRRARDRLAATGSALANATLPAASGNPARPISGPASGGSARQAVLAAVSRRLWAEHAARVRAIEAKTDRVMRGG